MPILYLLIVPQDGRLWLVVNTILARRRNRFPMTLLRLELPYESAKADRDYSPSLARSVFLA